MKDWDKLMAFPSVKTMATIVYTDIDEEGSRKCRNELAKIMGDHANELAKINRRAERADNIRFIIACACMGGIISFLLFKIFTT